MDLLLKFLSQPVVAIILLLGILILAHEMGHFIVGKLCGIAVEIFSIGFGPVLARVRIRDTEYRLSAVPLGGFVKFFGATRFDEVPPGIRGRPFHSSPLYVRFLTIAAGPFFNFILAAITYMAMGMHGIPQLPPVIGDVIEGSPAQRAGLQFGDRIVQIDNWPTKNWTDVQQNVAKAAHKPLTLIVQRGKKTLTVNVTADSVKDEDDLINENRGQIGITPGQVPSFVTIVRYDGLAARSGFIQGDKITEISYGPGHNEKVEYWHQFLLDIKEARNQGVDQITVQVARGENEGMSTIIKLSLAELPRSDLSDTQIESFLGIRDGQLTIKSIMHGIPLESSEDDTDNAPAQVGNKLIKAVSYSFLKPGDTLLQWEGTPLHDLFQYSKIASSCTSRQVNLLIQRGSAVIKVLMDLQRIDLQRAEGRVVRYRLPVTFLGEFKQPEIFIEKYGLTGGIVFGYEQTVQQSVVVAKAVVGLFTGSVPLKALGGPISIGKVASDSVKLGILTFLAALAMISINLGLLNLVPIPVLDGGQVVLLIAEAIYRRPLPGSVIESFQKIGFIMVLALVIMATYNDISRFWLSMLEGVVGYFQ